MTPIDMFKKMFKRLYQLEPSSIILRLVPVTSFLIACLFYIGQFSSPSDWGSSSSTALGRHVSLGFFDEGGESCNVFEGNWIWDDEYPLYRSTDCPFIDQSFRCLENGRSDTYFTKWRWQPRHCNLPRFDAKRMLEKLRNRRLVFVGDSIGRNQWESLLCMLSPAVSKSAIYELDGVKISKHKRTLGFKFMDYNCTIEYYWAAFLVVQQNAHSGPEAVKMTINLDQVIWSSAHWKDADILIFNSGHWWNYEKTIKLGIYFKEGEEVDMEMSVETAFRKSIETFITWLGNEVNMKKTKVFFRTYAPLHYRNGDWTNGGSCHFEKLPYLGVSTAPRPIHFDIVAEVLRKRWNESQVMNLNILNVTEMSSIRKDGHASKYYYPRNASSHSYPHNASSHSRRQDCSHWCLPGVPDAWNELFYALFLKLQI